MILDIKKREKEKRIKIAGILFGVCVAVVSPFFAFFILKKRKQRKEW